MIYWLIIVTFLYFMDTLTKTLKDKNVYDSSFQASISCLIGWLVCIPPMIWAIVKLWDV